MLDFYGWGLECEGFWLGKALMLLRELHAFAVAVVLAVFGSILRVVVEVRWERGRHGGFGEAWGVWGRLAAQLGEVEVGAGAVAQVHGFVQLALGVEAVEDDGVDGDGDDFDDDFDDGADEGPGL